MRKLTQQSENTIMLEYTQSFSSGPQASSTPTQDPSNITWASDLSPIKTTTSNKNASILSDVSPDPFGFKAIRGIRPMFKKKRSKPSLKESGTTSDETSSSNSSLSFQENNPHQNLTNEKAPLDTLSRHRSTRTRQKNIKYKEDNENDDFQKKKRKYTRKNPTISENINEENEIITNEDDPSEFNLKKQVSSSKNIIEYFREVDKFKLDVEDVPADFTSEH